MRRGLGLAVIAVALASCSGGGGTSPIGKENQLTFETGSARVDVPVERWDVFLVDPEFSAEIPESFLLFGPDWQLVGELPAGLRVGYGEEFERLVGRSLTISPSGSPGGEGPYDSKVPVGGSLANVKSGTIRVEEIVGPPSDGAGKLLQGTIEIDVEGHGRLKGSFHCLAKTWG